MAQGRKAICGPPLVYIYIRHLLVAHITAGRLSRLVAANSSIFGLPGVFCLRIIILPGGGKHVRGFAGRLIPMCFFRALDKGGNMYPQTRHRCLVKPRVQYTTRYPDDRSHI